MSPCKRPVYRASKTSKKTKVTHPPAATSGSAPPTPNVQLVAITEVKTLAQVVDHFSLHHQRTNPELAAYDDVSFMWPISDLRLVGWFSRNLSSDITREIDLAVEEGSALSEFIFKYRLGASLASEPSSRPAVDLILLAAASIVNGASSIYRDGVDTEWVEPARGGPSATQKVLKRVKLLYEIPIAFHDEFTRNKYSGRMDCALGLEGRLAPCPASGSTDTSTRADYRILLTVVEVKAPSTYSQTEAQLLAYMGCLYRNREARGSRGDCSAFGIITDGMKWEFFMSDHQGASGEQNQRTNVPVRQSGQYSIYTHDNLRKVLGMIIWILQRGAVLLTGQDSPEEGVNGEDDGAIVGLRVAV